MLNRRLKGVAVSVSNVDLKERLRHLTDKIYREMLCITRHERMTIITMPYRIVLTWEFLAWITVESRIPWSFTNLIATPELSGPLYNILQLYLSTS